MVSTNENAAETLFRKIATTQRTLNALRRVILANSRQEGVPNRDQASQTNWFANDPVSIPSPYFSWEFIRSTWNLCFPDARLPVKKNISDTIKDKRVIV
jgi:hypothetical protein